MDLYYLQKNAILIPTPGQTEQEYLASINMKNHLILKQSDICSFNFSKSDIQNNTFHLPSVKTSALDTLIDEIINLTSRH
jgi:hypothetical protein